MTAMAPVLAKFSDRTRFNWGYHDARFEILRNLPSRVGVHEVTIIQGGRVFPLPDSDPAYAAGYRSARAMADRGDTLSELSSAAWVEFYGSEVDA